MNYAKQMLGSMTEEQKQEYRRQYGEVGYQKLVKDAEGTDEMSLPREEFDQLDHSQRHEFIQNGGRVFTSEPEPPERPDLPEGQVYRDRFDAMSPQERHAFVTGGGSIID